MSKNSPWILTVLRTERLTPHMQRITFGGDGLAEFPENSESAYLKLVFPTTGQSPGMRIKRRIGRLLGRESYAIRSYTIRRFNAAARELDIDFVVHEHGGYGSRWALEAVAGDVLQAGGPGPAKLLSQSGDWCLVVGDMSALPAIAANLENLSEDATGYVIVEILDAEDQQSLAAPPGIEVHWVVNPDPRQSAATMLEAVQALQWRDGVCEAWVASELDTVREIRSYLRNVQGVAREQMYASSYWQLGRTDEQHRVEKAADQEKAASAG